MSQARYEQGGIPELTLGWRLQMALAYADLSVEQMVDELGVSRSTLSRWLNDRGTPSRGYVKLWALRCGVPYVWLRDGASPQHEQGFRTAPTSTSRDRRALRERARRAAQDIPTTILDPKMAA